MAASSNDKFLVRPLSDPAPTVEGYDGELAGEVYAIKSGDNVYGIAGADGQAEAARKANEAERIQAEDAREEAESDRAEAETARVNAEGDRVEAEEARDTAEGKRATAESSRQGAETDRVSAEEGRAEAESDRAEAETGRVNAEKARASAESSRASAETKRVSAESARASAESKRATAESGRASAETGRVNAEEARVEAEIERETAQAKNNADQAANNAAMQKLSPVILTAGQYDPDTLEPTIEGEPNRMYFVPMVAAQAAAFGLKSAQARAAVEAGNLYLEWMWINEQWEQMGTSTVEVTPIQTGDIDDVAAGESPSGDKVLNLTGLSYLWSKLTAAFAAIAHKHSAADITSGTLPISRGGTGAADAASARSKLGVTLANLGLTATAAELNKMDGVTATTDEINRLDGVTSPIQTQLNGKAASSHTHAASQVTGITASRALVSDASGHPAASAVTATELGYLDGVTGNVQTQLNDLGDSLSRVVIGETVTKFEVYYNASLAAMVFLAGSSSTGKEYNLLIHDDGTISSVITEG